jgi:hypothetical protein
MKAAKKKAPARKRAPKSHAAPKVLMGIEVTVTGLPYPAVGQYWKGQGGLYLGPVVDDEGKQCGRLVAATTPAGELIKLKGAYGSYGKRIGADSYRDSAANTAKMLKNDSSLAREAAALKLDGHQDFSVASQCHLNILRAQLPKQAAGVGYVMSSTEDDADCAWCQNFSYGHQNLGGKGDDFGAFAVRMVPE